MKKSPLPIPTFASEDEERAFWQDPRHDSTDYLDWSQARVVEFPNLKPSIKAAEAHPSSSK